jgi:hypothetical protein
MAPKFVLDVVKRIIETSLPENKPQPFMEMYRKELIL